MVPDLLAFRVDADPQIGAGHLMRCLALAQSWRSGGGECLFITASKKTSIFKPLESEGIRIFFLPESADNHQDFEKTASCASRHKASFIVVDGYRFDGEYQKALKAFGFGVLFMDDYGHAGLYDADLVLNQNAYATAELYTQRSRDTQLLLGCRYLLLRKEFLKRRAWHREVQDKADKVLVTMGGSDKDGVVFKVMQALEKIEISLLDVRVVTGGGYEQAAELQDCAKCLPFKIQLEHNVSDITDLMVWADVAVSSAGTTSWELAFLGLPSLVMPISDNQRPVAQWLDHNGLARNLGWHADCAPAVIADALKNLISDVEGRRGMAQEGRRWVDGLGAERVCTHIKSRLLILRKAEQGDSRRIWEWNNQPEVRSASFSQEPILWQDHQVWFDSQFKNPNYLIYVAQHSHGESLGHIRFDHRNGEAVVSVVVDAKFRGQGYGSAMIYRGAQEAFNSLNTDKIYAYVKRGNETSISAFLRAGFKEAESKTMRGEQVLSFVLERGQKL